MNIAFLKEGRGIQATVHLACLIFNFSGHDFSFENRTLDIFIERMLE